MRCSCPRLCYLTTIGRQRIDNAMPKLHMSKRILRFVHPSSLTLPNMHLSRTPSLALSSYLSRDVRPMSGRAVLYITGNSVLRTHANTIRLSLSLSVACMSSHDRACSRLFSIDSRAHPLLHVTPARKHTATPTHWHFTHDVALEPARSSHCRLSCTGACPARCSGDT